MSELTRFKNKHKKQVRELEAGIRLPISKVSDNTRPVLSLGRGANKPLLQGSLLTADMWSATRNKTFLHPDNMQRELNNIRSAYLARVQNDLAVDINQITRGHRHIPNISDMGTAISHGDLHIGMDSEGVSGDTCLTGSEETLVIYDDVHPEVAQ